MTHRILVTALFDEKFPPRVSYYCAKDINEKVLYCDALLPAEASCKYALSAFPIDEIIVFGSEEVAPTEEEKPAALFQKQKTMSPFLMETTSEFSILKYRLMQFYDDVNIEFADQNSLLSEAEQRMTVSFLHRFFYERVDPEGKKRLSRYLHYLIQDPALCEEFENALRAWLFVSESESVAGGVTDSFFTPPAVVERYKVWILQYLYRKLKASSKFEPLDRNENVRIRYLCIPEKEMLSFISRLMPLLRDLTSDAGVSHTVELYVCLQNKQMADIFDMLNSLNLLKIMPTVQIRIVKVLTETQISTLPAYELLDQTQKYNMFDLLIGTGAFLSYGKTDLLVEYWKGAKLSNPKIDQIIYAMRNIDSGISLCDIADLERGLRSLREAIRGDLSSLGETPVEKYFEFVVRSIQQDYGSLLEGDQLPFIDLVKWSYRKGFLQQTLTLIESRAPRDFVDRGIYFYSDGERTRRHAVEILGQIYYDMKPFEKYKMDDVSHYFIKYYSRRRVPHTDGDGYQLTYANIRIEDLDTRDESLIRALTICRDRAALKDLLFAYYHLCDVRNMTNHATEEYSGFYTIMADDDPGERMKLITQAIDYFIHCYETVDRLITGKSATVVTVDTAELADYAQALRRESRRSDVPVSRQDGGRNQEISAAADTSARAETPQQGTAVSLSVPDEQRGKAGWREFK